MDTKSPANNTPGTGPQDFADSTQPLSGKVPDVTVGTKKGFWALYKLPLIIGAVLALLILVAGAVYFLLINPNGRGGSQPETTGTPAPGISGTVSGTPVPSVTGLTGTPTVTPTPGFLVTAVTASVDNPMVNSCSHTFYYTGQITANAAGTVIYQWQRSDGSISPPATVAFTGAETKTVNYSWSLGCSAICNDWMKLMVTAPNAMETANVTHTLSCSAADFNGDWYHNFGSAHVTQTGNTVTGTYLNKLNSPIASGTLNGTVSGSSLSGSWNNSGNSGSLMWVKIGNSFSGNWNGTYSWCGAKPGTQFPHNCSFGGEWKIKVSDPEICPGGDMNIIIMVSSGGDYNVTGTYCNGTITGVMTFSEGTAVLDGTWNVSGGASGTLKFWLTDAYNAQQFRGHYDSGGTQYQWCGWRSSSVQPGVCFR